MGFPWGFRLWGGARLAPGLLVAMAPGWVFRVWLPGREQRGGGGVLYSGYFFFGPREQGRPRGQGAAARGEAGAMAGAQPAGFSGMMRQV